MGDYDLTGLSPRSFEHMIQALACKVLGPGIVIFGDGPDGGREATFKGKLSAYPSAGKSWDGYGVVQAKFRQRPKMKPKEDSKWALQQLEKELKDFAKRGTKRKRPQFYIFATNVVLSPAPRVGGKDKASQLVNAYRKTIGLKDYRIWDYDQICRFLDSDEDVRKAYGAWITPGDVLAKLAVMIEKKTPDFSKVMVNFIQKEILDDHYSKLEQAGHSPENRIALEEVFVDLPAFSNRRSVAPKEEQGALLPGFLAEMLTVGATCLRPEEPWAVASKDSIQDPGMKGERGRFVLVGGPGQGKSTLAQFLCQMNRANLLKDRCGLDSEVKEAVKSIAKHCSSQQLWLQIARRFPLRVELARFAKALGSPTETGVTSVLSYVAYLVKDRTNYDIHVEDLRQWLEEYPWLVVLDGLDEVPASSNRSQVLAAVRDFFVDISMCNGDVLVLATTRPQGYNDEFSPTRYHHRWLAPLAISRALHYGQTLAEITYAHNAPRKKEVLARLKNAATNPATARLMESPLQVTIMARLLAQVAQPPQERYKLFHQYYKVIYRREMERGVEKLSQLLRDYEADVDSIHHRTGLLLQMESERTRHTDATITIHDFRRVVTDRLQGEGHSGEDLQKLTDAIATCATDRLVFLVPSQSETVGFEIRSLQEFMAAEALMDGPDNLVVKRLRAIASVPSWENVLLFAAGKCFAERQWLRDSVSQMCGELNDDPGDDLAHLTLAGSRMAVSLLEDGPARRQPAYAQALARRALGLLALPPERIHERLADVYEPGFETVYREELCCHLESGEVGRDFAAWALISKAVDGKGRALAQEMIEPYWPKDPDQVANLLSALDFPKARWAGDAYAKIFFDIPSLFHARFYRADSDPLDLLQSNPLAVGALRLALGAPEKERFEVSGASRSRTLPRLSFPMIPLARSRDLLAPFKALGRVHEYWGPLKEGARAAMQPSPERIAQALEAVAESFYPNPSELSYAWCLPWPMSACLAAARNKGELRNLASRMGRGEMGEPHDWMKAEARWRSNGINDRDLAHMTDERWPIPREIAKIGFPLACLSYGWIIYAESIKRVDDVEAFWASLPGQRAKSVFVPLIMSTSFGFRFSWRDKNLKAAPCDVNLISDMVTALEGVSFVSATFVWFVISAIKDSKEAPELMDRLGRNISDIYVRLEGSREGQSLQEIARFAVEFLERDPARGGVVNLLAALASNVRIERLPACLKKLRRTEEPAASSAAVVLQLVDRDAGFDAMRQIARDVLDKCGSHEPLLFKALDIYENHQMENPAGFAFLEKLLTGLPSSQFKPRQQVLRILTELLGRRVAPLSDRETWNNLCLPEGLFSLLSD